MKKRTAARKRIPYFRDEVTPGEIHLSRKEEEILCILGNLNNWRKLEELPALPSTLFRMVDKQLLWEKQRPTTEFLLARKGMSIFLANYSETGILAEGKYRLNVDSFRERPTGHRDWRFIVKQGYIVKELIYTESEDGTETACQTDQLPGSVEDEAN